MKDFLDENDHHDLEDLAEGMNFLMDLELLEQTSEEGGLALYGVTQDGVRALYMLGMVMASGVTTDELEGKEQPAEARQISQCAQALVKAMDEMGAQSILQ